MKEKYTILLWKEKFGGIGGEKMTSLGELREALDKIDNEIKSISYLRAIQEEFGIDIWNMIPQPQ